MNLYPAPGKGGRNAVGVGTRQWRDDHREVSLSVVRHWIWLVFAGYGGRFSSNGVIFLNLDPNPSTSEYQI